MTIAQSLAPRRRGGIGALVGLLCAVAWLRPAEAATYFVATTGSDSNSGSQASLPLRTIQKGVGLLKAGDTLLIRAGTYAGFEINQLHGTAAAPITIKAYPGEKVVVDRKEGHPAYHIIHINQRCSYLVLEDLEVTDSDPYIDQLRKLDLKNPTDLALLKVALDKGLLDFRNAVRINPPSTGTPHHHLTFRKLRVHHILGLGFSGRGEHLHFIDNLAYDLGWPRSGYGWYTSGRSHLYRGNTVHSSVYGFHLYAETTAVDDFIVEGNRVYGNGGTYYHMTSENVKSGGTGLLLQAAGGNNIVRNNLVHDNKYSGIVIHSSSSKVLNNTVYRNGGSGLLAGGSTTVVKNNVVFANGSGIINQGTGNILGSNLTVDPLFVSTAAAPDLRLTLASPAVDKGETLAEVIDDFAGTKRPQGKAYDIGAYELGGPASPEAGPAIFEAGPGDGRAGDGQPVPPGDASAERPGSTLQEPAPSAEAGHPAGAEPGGCSCQLGGSPTAPLILVLALAAATGLCRRSRRPPRR